MNSAPPWDALLLKLALVCVLSCAGPAPVPWASESAKAPADPLAQDARVPGYRVGGLTGTVMKGAQAQASPAADKPPEDPLAELPADVKGKLGKFIEKLNTAKRAIFDKQMKEVTDALVKATGLTGDEGARQLADAARDAEDRSLAEWSLSVKKMLLKEYQQSPAEALGNIDMLMSMVGTFAVQGDTQFRHTPPDEQPAWNQALARILNPQQFAAWNQVKDKSANPEDKETARFLDAQCDRVSEQYNASMLAETAEITTSLALPKERADKLDVLARSTVEQTVKSFRKTTAKMLTSMQAEQRQLMLKQNNVYYGVQDADAPTKQEVWKVGLETLLTDADRQKLREVQEEHKARRALALGQVLLALMDDKVAFTAAQRGRLQAAATQAVQETKQLFPEAMGPGTYFQYQRETFFGAAGRIKEADVRPVLDALQWEHWQEGCKAADGRDNPQLRRRGRVEPEKEKADPRKVENLEPEEYERAISDCLDEKLGQERKRQLAVVGLKAEDAARVAGVGEPAMGRLRTAARGTVEQALVAWKTNLAQNVRGQVDNAGPENVRALLANLPDYQFRQNDLSLSEQENKSLWDRTVATELSAEQRAAWQQEIDARAAYKAKAIASIVLSEFDRRYKIPTAQAEKLAPLLAKAINDYGPDITRMFYYSYDYAPWYLQTYTMFLPLASVPEDDLKAVLGKQSWEHWSGSQECSNATNYWQNIKSYHEQRTKEKKK